MTAQANRGGRALWLAWGVLLGAALVLIAGEMTGRSLFMPEWKSVAHEAAHRVPVGGDCSEGCWSGCIRMSGATGTESDYLPCVSECIAECAGLP